MPSRAEATSQPGHRARVHVEYGLRAVAFISLLGALGQLAGALNRNGSAESASAVMRVSSADSYGTRMLSTVRAALLSPGNAGPRPVHLVAASVPNDTARALLGAALLAGVPVTWTDSAAGGALAVNVEALIDPKGGYELRVSAPAGVAVAVRDSLGLIDSVRASGGGGTVMVGPISGTVTAASTASQASAAAPAPATIRRILLLAEPGWEAKFTLAALEERGWTVDARFALGRNVAVTQGAPAAPDTARYAAVVALDSSALPHVAAVRRYVLSGGGLVVAGAAATLREFDALLPGRTGNRQPGVPGGLQTSTPLLGLAWRPITIDSNAVLVARSTRVTGTAAGTVAARRYGAGRVVQVAYDGLWEWRMAGPEGSVDAHRQWWSSLVSSVAFAPVLQTNAVKRASVDAPGNAAPYADTRALFGRPGAVPAVSADMNAATHWALLFMSVAVAALLAEWGSRRLRGAR